MKRGIVRSETRPDGAVIEFDELLLSTTPRKWGKEQLRIGLTRQRLQGESEWSPFHLSVHVWFRSRVGDFRPSKGVVTLHSIDFEALRRAMDTCSDAKRAVAIAAEGTG
jgi:hypothetical protein